MDDHARRSGFVALIGRPNAGKSTLLNRLVGEKVAIVSDKPQTTRTRILGVVTRPDGQMVFVDTPGIHKPVHRMNARMVALAVDAIGEVDVRALVVDTSVSPGRGDRYVLDLVKKAEGPTVLVLNKVDLVEKSALLPLIDQYRRELEFAAIVPVSALTGDGVDRLGGVLFGLLPHGEPLYPDDYLTDQPERAIVAEVVREKLLHHTSDELPYASAVVVDQFDEPDERGLMRVYCSILVESESQKPIVVGRQGAMIKRIGTEARHELEAFFGTRLYLDLHVKVKEGWREDERLLDQIGLGRRRD